MIRAGNIFGFLLIVALANWPYVYNEVSTQSIGTVDPWMSRVSPSESTKMAGWPMKYYQSSTLTDNQTITTFSWNGLLGTIVFWSSIPIMSFVYKRLMSKLSFPTKSKRAEEDEAESMLTQSEEKAASPASPQEAPRLRISDMFVYTTLVAGIFGYWILTTRRAAIDQALAYKIRDQGGFAIRTAMLPRLSEYVFRIFGYESFLRLRVVQLNAPDDEFLAKVVELHYLRSLGLSGGNYRFQTLHGLSTKPFLRDIGIVGASLDSEAISAIRTLPKIRTLNLMRTNITAAGVTAIGHPKLEELNLVHTDVQLKDLGKPAFSQNLRVLRLPHPLKGSGDSLLLEDWPRLQELSCYEHDEPLNKEPVSLTLRNLPKLAKIELDALQLFDIDCEQLPSLGEIVPAFHQWNQRTTPTQIVPCTLWARKLKLKQVPKLTDLYIFPTDTESIEIENPSMELVFCVYNKNASREGSATVRWAGRTPLGYIEPGYLSASDIPLSTRQKWIDDVAKKSVIANLDLEYVPLQGVNLAGLKENQSITKLMLGKSGLVPAQLKDIEGMRQLQELSLAGLYLDGQTIESLVNSFSKLQNLVCEADGVQRLRLENAPELESIFIKPKKAARSASAQVYPSETIGFGLQLNHMPLEAVRLVNVPKLRDNFISKVPLKHLYINGARSLLGLSFQEPLPSDVVVKDVEDLVFFAAGGLNCNDTIVQEVVKCKKLKSLTLAYTNLKPETLASIANLSELESLTLTGSKLDSTFLTSISALTKLKVLRLSHTSLDGADLSGIQQLKRLETLELGNWNTTSQQLEAFVESSPQIKQLAVGGSQLSPSAVGKIARCYYLKKLDLSGREVTDEIANALVKEPPESLVELHLDSSVIGVSALKTLVQGLPKVRFSLEGLKGAASEQQSLLERLFAEERVVYSGSRATTPYSPQGESSMTFEIDPMRFSPSYVPARDNTRGTSEYGSFDGTNTESSIPFPGSSSAVRSMTPLERIGFEMFNLYYRMSNAFSR